MTECKPEWKVILELLEKVDPELLTRLSRRMIYHLYTHKIREIEELMRELEPRFNASDDSAALYANVPNPRKDLPSLRRFVERVFQIAGASLPDADIAQQLSVWMMQERSRFLSIAVENDDISLVDITDALNRFVNLSQTESYISPDERMSIRVALIRRFLSSHLPYINVAKRYITIPDFQRLIKRTLGCAQGSGKLGGKSAGMILGYEIIQRERASHPELDSVAIPESWYLTSDAIMDFIHYNAMEEITSLKYMDNDQIRAGYPYLQQVFKNAFFSAEIVNQLAVLLDQVGGKPIIVRSSSLLEDSAGAAFSGKYKSLFLSNVGTLAERLNALLDAIAEIYASLFSPDPITYRKERGLLDFNEEMGILIQEVVGTRLGHYWFPLFAGVAFGYNEFRWSPRIEKEDGVVRLVFGLGTRAVDRVGDDYPCLCSPGKPNLRVNVRPEDVMLYSQKRMDLLNLQTNTFETHPVQDIIDAFGTQIPGIHNIVSIVNDGMISMPYRAMFNPKAQDYLVTFQGFIERTPFLRQIKTILDLLKQTFGSPMDVEFATDGQKLYFLQCRPQSTASAEEAAVIPANIPSERIVLASNKYITSGLLKGIEYIVYVVPEAYDGLAEASDMKEIAAIVSKLNQILPKRRFILVGPGRWGSTNIQLGVNVGYADISNAAVLAEVASEETGHIPEVSFGTHFFQDLVESRIIYAAVFPGQPESRFNHRFFSDAPNSLAEVLPDAGAFASLMKLIDVPGTAAGLSACVSADPISRQAVCYLA